MNNHEFYERRQSGLNKGRNGGESRNCLICTVCENYFTDPRLLSCYHTFCGRCIRADEEGRITCPNCSCQSQYADSSPPIDSLVKKLMDLMNADNPPCANCDKRERTSMYFCATCNQALCGGCKESTHKAKMFARHEITPMAGRILEGCRKCFVHGEPFVMYSLPQRMLLCAICFQDRNNDGKQNCVDIDTAYTQTTIKLEATIEIVDDTRETVVDSISWCRTNLNNLQHNAETENNDAHAFSYGLQEAINKTECFIASEIQRQYDQKDRSFRSLLMTLTTILPILDNHVVLCQNFSSVANKFQFLEVVSLMIDRLYAVANISQPIKPPISSQIKTSYRAEFARCLEPWVGKLLTASLQNSQESAYESSMDMRLKENLNNTIIPSISGPPSQKQQSALKAKALEGDTPFSNHCRSFYNQVEELENQLKSVRERLGELRTDVTVLRQSATPPLVLRHQMITQDLTRLCDTLEKNQVELERLRTVFHTVWQEQLYRIHVEQDIFQTQMKDIVNLQSEVKKMCSDVQSMQPFVSQLSKRGGADSDEIATLKSLLGEISQLKDTSRGSKINGMEKVAGKPSSIQKAASSSSDTKPYKDPRCRCETPVRDRRSRSSLPERKSGRSMLSQLFGRVKSKEKLSVKERSKSEEHVKESSDSTTVQSKNYVPPVVEEKTLPKEKTRRTSSFLHDQGYESFANVRDAAPSITRQYSMPTKHDDRNDLSQQSFQHIEYNARKDRGSDNKCDQQWQEFGYPPFGEDGSKKDSDYQSINEVCSNVKTINDQYLTSDEDDDRHRSRRSSSKHHRAPPMLPPRRTRTRKTYPHSDTEDIALCAAELGQAGTCRVGADGKTYVFLIGTNKKKRAKYIMQKQRSWETFPPKRKGEVNATDARFCRNPDIFRSHFDVAPIQSEPAVKKSGGFEGHEEAVSSLVRELQKFRVMDKQRQPQCDADDKD